MSAIRLKLLIDQEKNRVVFAESEKEFVDIIFSFLTLPMGTIIRLLNKQSSVGCIDNIYSSVENLDTKYLNTEACKTMLLEPRSSAARLCEDLLLSVDDLKPRRMYRCPNFDCFTKKSKVFSSVTGVNCSCGETINENFIWLKNKEKQQVFLKGEATYIISDDLSVFPSTLSNAVTLFQKLGVDDVDMLEERVVDVNRDMFLSLLKMVLLSKTPLTDVFLEKPFPHSKKRTKPTKLSQIKLENDTETQEDAINLMLAWDKSTKRVLYVEADHVMADTLFSFLTFPLGSIVKLLNKHSTLGCVDNLYNSIDILASSGNDCFVSANCKKMLLSPSLYLHYDCSHQILKIEPELLFRNCSVHGCKVCWDKSADICEHNISTVNVKEINPKMQNLVTENGGGYANKSAKFMISDEMNITPQSVISGIDVVKDFKVSIRSLILQEVAIGEAEVMNLLKACLTSSSVLNSVFSSAKMARKRY